MTITIERGTQTTAAESEFAGTVSPRHYKVDEALAAQTSEALETAFRGNAYEAMQLAALFGGRAKLSEAFSTSDFKLAAFKELDTEMLAQYQELPSVWAQYCDQTLVSDFRPKRLGSRYSGTVGLPRVPELTEYPDGGDYNADYYAITVAKHGRRRALSWEAWINNEAVDELENIPADLSRQARETETINAVGNLLLIDPVTLTASNVNTDFFKTANGNAPGNLPLTRANLKTVLDGMATKKDPNTKRVVASPEMVVVVPKALESTIVSIVRPTVVRTTVNGVEVEENNEFASLSYVVEPMLDYLNTHARAATTWFVVPKPGSNRPALWTAKLRGHEQPDLRVKADQGSTVGGGAISYTGGSFEIDDIQWRVRHVVGRQTGSPLFTYASYGA